MTDPSQIFRFEVVPFEGALLIESFYPARIDVGRLSVTIADYYDLWDVDEPILALADVTKVVSFSDDLKKILHSVLTRTALQSNFVSASWYTGGNAIMTAVLEEILIDMAGTTSSIFETRDEAVSYLSHKLARYRDGLES